MADVRDRALGGGRGGACVVEAAAETEHDAQVHNTEG